MAMSVEGIPADTTPEAAAVQLEIYRQMHPLQRLELALSMGDTGRSLATAGVRSRHPEYSDEQVRLAVIRLTLGEELFREAYPGVEIQP
jgi:hypothetical protein